MKRGPIAWNITLVTALLLPGVALASGGGEVAPLVIVADSRGLTGVMLFWAQLYNESRLMFTLMTVVLIPLIGVIFGMLADQVISRIGIDLHSREFAEH